MLEPDRHPLKRQPDGARQHITAGPYSPVLEVDARRIVVISGQVAVALDGTLIGGTARAQAEVALRNCADQLGTAGCTLADVFKVNIYLADIGDWDGFNQIYREIMPAPLPVRTAIQAVLLPGILVEIEMWAVKAEA